MVHVAGSQAEEPHAEAARHAEAAHLAVVHLAVLARCSCRLAVADLQELQEADDPPAEVALQGCLPVEDQEVLAARSARRRPGDQQQGRRLRQSPRPRARQLALEPMILPHQGPLALALRPFVALLAA